MIHERSAAHPEVGRLLRQGTACFCSRIHQYAVQPSRPVPCIGLECVLLATIVMNNPGYRTAIQKALSGTLWRKNWTLIGTLGTVMGLGWKFGKGILQDFHIPENEVPCVNQRMG